MGNWSTELCRHVFEPRFCSCTQIKMSSALVPNNGIGIQSTMHHITIASSTKHSLLPHSHQCYFQNGFFLQVTKPNIAKAKSFIHGQQKQCMLLTLCSKQFEHWEPDGDASCMHCSVNLQPYVELKCVAGGSWVSRLLSAVGWGVAFDKEIYELKKKLCLL